MIIGGVEIPHEFGLDGHSDADVLAHAIMDALLGAAALGDIGKMFPDKDPQYKDADSMELLQQVMQKVREKGYILNNLDTIIVAQRPKVAPHIPAMRQKIAQACQCDIDCVSIKATTEEHLGFTGREQGICAHCVCLIDHA